MIEIERDPYIHCRAEKIRHLGVKAILFDLDDTLIETSPIYTRNKKIYSEAVAQSLGIESGPVLKRLQEIHDESFKTNGVDPNKWIWVLNKLGEELGSPQIALEHYPLIEKIYYEIPKLLPGVRQLLTGIKNENLLIGEATHGKTDWSFRKNEQTGIINYMDYIVAASVLEKKSKKHWQLLMDGLSVTPEECIITGDNLMGDIIPAIELGARAIYIPSPWHVYRQGEIPSGVVTINTIAEFWDGIDKLE